MNKTLFAAALALALSFGGLAVSAADEEASPENYTALGKVSFQDGQLSSSVSENLKLLVMGSSDVSLKDNLAQASQNENNKDFGYLRNGSEFVSLKDAMNDAEVVSLENEQLASISLGKFNKDDTIRFGYGSNANGSDFSGNTVSLNVAADPGYYAGYNADGFFQLDFSEKPFDGTIEILVVGEPLPASTVSLLVALGAGAVFLLYRNRRRRAVGAVQA